MINYSFLRCLFYPEYTVAPALLLRLYNETDTPRGEDKTLVVRGRFLFSEWDPFPSSFRPLLQHITDAGSDRLHLALWAIHDHPFFAL